MIKTVADVMTPEPITVRKTTSLQDAIKLMAQKRISGLPVVDDQDHLIGVISETDLMWKETGVDPPPYIMFLDSVIYLQNPTRHNKEIHKALGETVQDVMTDQPISITPDKSLKDAAHLMHDKNIRRLPVVDDHKVIGIITRGDIIRTMAME
jgi:CBS domain-containing protein